MSVAREVLYPFLRRYSKMNSKKLAALLWMVSLSVGVAGCGAEPTNDDAASTSGPLTENDEAMAGVACRSGYFCVIWGQNFEGAYREFARDEDARNPFTRDHMNMHFLDGAPGAPGEGEIMGNNAGSFANLTSDRSLEVYYNPSINGERPSGPSLHLGPNDQRNCTGAGILCNNNRSHFWN